MLLTAVLALVRPLVAEEPVRITAEKYPKLSTTPVLTAEWVTDGVKVGPKMLKLTAQEELSYPKGKMGAVTFEWEPAADLSACKELRFWAKIANTTNAEVALALYPDNSKGGRYLMKVPLQSAEWTEIFLPLATWQKVQNPAGLNAVQRFSISFRPFGSRLAKGGIVYLDDIRFVK